MIKETQINDLAKSMMEKKVELNQNLDLEPLAHGQLKNEDMLIANYRGARWSDEKVQILIKNKFADYDYGLFVSHSDILKEIFYNTFKDKNPFLKLIRDLHWTVEEVKSFIGAGFFAFRDYALIKKHSDDAEKTNTKISDLLKEVIRLMQPLKKDKLSLPIEARSLGCLLRKAGYAGLSFFSGLNETEATIDELFFALIRATESFEYKLSMLDLTVDLPAVQGGYVMAKTHFARSFKNSLRIYTRKTVNIKRPGIIVGAMCAMGNILFERKNTDKGAFRAEDFKGIPW